MSLHKMFTQNVQN